MKLAGAEARLLRAPVGVEPFGAVVPLVGVGMLGAGAGCLVGGGGRVNDTGTAAVPSNTLFASS